MRADGNQLNTGSIRAISSIVPGTTLVTTVALLPTGTLGDRAAVTDANAAFTAGIGTIVAGGGSNKVPVFFDGTNWRIG